MKIREILEGIEGRETPNWSEEEIKKVFPYIRSSMTRKDVLLLAKELATSFHRSKSAVYFILLQLYTAIHGEYPYGVVKAAGEWNEIHGPVRRFLIKKGIDVDLNVANAHAEMANRVATVGPPKRGRPNQKRMADAARQAMYNYYKEHKHELPANINVHRKEILQDISNGIPPEIAFAKYS